MKQTSRVNTATAAAMYRAGATLQEIGTAHGVTRERVRQILEAAGVERRHSKPRVERACMQCSKRFWVKPSAGRTRRFCGRECMGLAKRRCPHGGNGRVRGCSACNRVRCWKYNQRYRAEGRCPRCGRASPDHYFCAMCRKRINAVAAALRRRKAERAAP